MLNILRERGLLDACTSEGSLSEATQKPVRVYCGFDPTADSLHLGNLLESLYYHGFSAVDTHL